MSIENNINIDAVLLDCLRQPTKLDLFPVRSNTTTTGGGPILTNHTRYIQSAQFRNCPRLNSLLGILYMYM